jgi:hypothetical protein
MNADLRKLVSKNSSLFTIIIITIFMDYAMLGLFHPLEEYVILFFLTVGVHCFYL